MKRDILNLKRSRDITGCCPGHDTFPTSSYNNRRSKKARTRDKKIEHRLARRVMKLRMEKSDD